MNERKKNYKSHTGITKVQKASLDKSEDFNLPKCNLNSTVSCNFMPFLGKGMQVWGRCHEKARDKMPKGRSAKRKKKGPFVYIFVTPLHFAWCHLYSPHTHYDLNYLKCDCAMSIRVHIKKVTNSFIPPPSNLGICNIKIEKILGLS